VDCSRLGVLALDLIKRVEQSLLVLLVKRAIGHSEQAMVLLLDMLLEHQSGVRNRKTAGDLTPGRISPLGMT
jgi:hypothetical protein